MDADVNSTWYVGSRLTYSCEEGFQLLHSERNYQGEQAVGVCTESGSWKFDYHCQGTCPFPVNLLNISICGKYDIILTSALQILMNVRILTHVIPKLRNVPILLEITLAHVNQDTAGMYKEFAKVKSN